MDIQLPSRGELVDVARLLGRPVPLALNAAGLGCVAATVWFGFSEPLVAVGGVLLSVGLSAPLAQHFELRQRATTDEITHVCDQVGLRTIYSSRLKDRERFRAGVGNAFSKSRRLGKANKIRLQGIAFHRTFDSHIGDEYSKPVCRALNDPRVPLEVLILNPDSEDARLRAAAEGRNLTIRDIRSTLEIGLPAVARNRLNAVLRKNGRLLAQIMATSEKPQADDGRFPSILIDEIVKACNLSVRLTDRHPMAFVIITKYSVFSEQYLIGRPPHLPVGACIGKQLPVCEYVGSSEQAAFYSAHFEWNWRQSEDRTHMIVRDVLEQELSWPIDHDLPRVELEVAGGV